ncbi:Variant surface glycoprotein [Trypanosoma congolense IL3000]|uniref:Variant surface glycoprotein n=1 Tax=Trypanosoma congolense (strain IL3000) TaxID=1068625 RepID=F9WHC1_TRYCI|nr:Variant surface glycoprotein [Trypanosoma congolense IL3000]
MMMRIQFCIVVIIFVGIAAEKNHNEHEHARLCSVLGAAVDKWRDIRTRDPTDTLRKALGRTIFGNESGGELTDLEGTLPKEYNGVEGISGSRSSWCGGPHEETNWQHQWRWSGHSAPHDMACLCTVGEEAWPVNKSATTTDNDKLCGQGRSALGADDSKGWGYTEHEGNRHVEATWKAIVTPCLLESGKKDDLKKALEVFIDNLNHTYDKEYRDMYRLGEGKYSSTHYAACTGSSSLGVCVMYYTSFPPEPWWRQLQEAILEDEQIQKRLAEEEKKRKQQDKTEKEDSAQKAALTSGTQTNNQTEQHRNANLTEKLRKLNLTSGTPISMPSSWLLRAVFLF